MTDSMKRGFARLRNQEHDGPKWRILDLTPYLVAREPEDDNPIPAIGEVVLPVNLKTDIVPIVRRENSIAPDRLALDVRGRPAFGGALDDAGSWEDAGGLDDEPESDDGDGDDGGVGSVLDALEGDDEITSEMVAKMASLVTAAVAGPGLAAKLGGVEVDEVVVSEHDGQTVIVETDGGRFGIGPTLDAAISAFATRERYIAIPCYPATVLAADAALAEIVAASNKIASSGAAPADHVQVGDGAPDTKHP